MSICDYHLFVNILRFCDKSHLFPLLLTSKRIHKLTWKYLIDFLEIDLEKIFIKIFDKPIDENINEQTRIEIIKKLLDDERLKLTNVETYFFDIAENSDYKIGKMFLNHKNVILNEECKRVISYCTSPEITELFLQDERTRFDNENQIFRCIIKNIEYGEYEILKVLLEYYPKRVTTRKILLDNRMDLTYINSTDEEKLDECLCNRIRRYGIKNVEKLKFECKENNFNMSFKSKEDYETMLILLIKSEYISLETRQEFLSKIKELYEN